MNVLLIAQAYPPYPLVGALRAEKVARAFQAQGHTVFVVTERLEGEAEAVRTREPGLEVHTVKVGLPYRLRLVRLRNRLRGLRRRAAGTAVPAAGTAVPVRVERRGGLLRRLALALLWLPDDEQRFILPALRTARRLAPHGIDLVYTTAPSFSSHLVGLILRRTSHLRWVAEFRDPWTDQRDARCADAVDFIERLHCWLERQCLRAADRVVAVTEGARRQFAAKLPARERSKVLVALNGIDELAPPDAMRAPGPFRVVYAGTLYHNRDPRPFLAALAALRRERGLTPADVRVDFVGRCRSFEDVSVEGIVREHGLADLVHFHDWVPHDVAQSMLRNADLVLLIAQGQPLQVPNKLFDYLGTRRPVLGVVDAGGETEEMLRRVGGHHVVSVPVGETASVEAMREALQAALDRSARGAPAAAANEERLEEWLASRQMRRLVSAIAT